MIVKFIKWIDLLAAIFLMFLFPAICIHVKLRDRLFEAYTQRVKEYGEMFQKQGYLSVEAAEKLLCGTQGDLGAITLDIWQEREGEKRMLTISQLEAVSCDYMGTKVYPFADGEGLLFVLRMRADGFEKAFYYFCGHVLEREYTCFFIVRDGLKERWKEQVEEASETISLFDTFYDFVFGDCVNAACEGTDSIAPDERASESGKKCGHRGGCSGRISGNL